MRRFEFVQGTSNKFWQIAISGPSLSIQWGRIGTAGQSQVKSFPSDAAAQKEHDKLVAEKLKKDYVEVGTPAAASSAPAPAPVAAAPAPVAAPGKTAPPPVAPPVVVADQPTIPDIATVDEDTVHWTEALRKRVFPRRGGMPCPVPTVPSAKTSWAKLQKAFALREELVEKAIKARSDGHEILSRLQARLRSDEPSIGSVDDDATLIAMLLWEPQYHIKPEDTLPLDLLFAIAGLPHAIAAKLVGMERTFDADARLFFTPSYAWNTNFHKHGKLCGLDRLRALLAVAPEQAYLAARDAAQTIRDSGTLAQKAATSFLFPTEVAWVQADMAHLSKGKGHAYVLASLADPESLAQTSVDADWLFGGVSYQKESQDVAASLLEGCGLGATAFFLAHENPHADAVLTRSRCAVLGALGCDEAMRSLIAAIDQKESQAALVQAVQTQPRRALRLLGEAATQRGKAGEAAKQILVGVVRRAPGLAEQALEASTPEVRRVIESLLAETQHQQREADPEAIPEILTSPPWRTTRTGTISGVVHAVPALDVPDELVWVGDEQEAWARSLPWSTRWQAAPAQWRALAEKEVRVDLACLLECPTELFPVLADRAKADWNDCERSKKIAAKHGLVALPFLEDQLARGWSHTFPCIVPFGSTRLAPQVAETLAKKKSLRADARRWLLRHPRHAAAGLLATALGAPGRARREAEAALRYVAANGGKDIVLELAENAGVRDATAALLDQDPLQGYPDTLPKRPPYLELGGFPLPILRDDKGALPAPAAESLLTMLSFSTLEEPYAGLALVKEACEPASLARFAWEVFQSWLINGAPSKDSWCMNALGHLGDDAAARKLAALVREWPGQAAHARAVAGLDVLAAIGTDIALMHLNGIALKAKFKGLQANAQEKIAAVAEARGLSREELEDRLAPDLGLDDDGSLVLDFGPRSFHVGFDEQLRPFVKDAEGSRLKDLPKPGKSDDAAKAEAAARAWKQLKKDAKTAASQQILRLELAMCGQRRFPAEDFQALFVDHPLVFHVVRRLVWATYDNQNAVAATFRVAEDRTFADADDNAWTLPAGATVGVPHPLELATATGRWSRVFADYEIVQPFAQLGRPTYLPNEDEQNPILDRVKGVKVPTGKVLGLEQRRWRRGDPQDAGVVCWMEKQLADHVVYLALDPGIYAGMLSEFPEQTLGSCTLDEDGYGSRTPSHRFSELSPIEFSELIGDLERLKG